MTSNTFNQLFDAYQQKAVETSVASVSPMEEKPTWLLLLQRHVQEWKQHYGRESQAIEEVRDNYQRIRRQAGPLSPGQQLAIRTDEDRQSGEVTMSFQAKRDLIWARQQQELNSFRYSA